MSKIRVLVLSFFMLFIACQSKTSEYPIEKRYWTVEDYENVIRHIKYGLKPGQKPPTFSNPETKIIVEKLTDQNNYLVILDDDELGIKYRDKIAEDYFRVWKDMSTIYGGFDKKDKFLYEKEYLKVWHFGLELQIKYFSLGNQVIMKNSDDSDSFYTNSTINSNQKSLIGNFNIYLDKINQEDSFSQEGINLFNYGIKKYVKGMIESIPKADFKDLSYKINSLMKKIKNESTKKELKAILSLIDLKKSENTNKKS